MSATPWGSPPPGPERHRRRTRRRPRPTGAAAHPATIPRSAPHPRRLVTAIGAVVALASAILLAGPPAIAATPPDTWTQVPTPTTPPARANALMAFDPNLGSHGETVLFGGNAEPPLNDTWTFDGTTWTQVETPVSPPVFEGNGPIFTTTANMAYDPSIGKILLYGMAIEDGQTVVETWTFDGTTWSQLSPATNPTLQFGAAMAYDPSLGAMVLFGGVNRPGAVNATWTFDGTTWSQLSPATSPSARFGAAMAYDPTLGRMVLFGGMQGATADTQLNDTWTFDGTTWVPVDTPGAPSARVGALLAYDAADETLVLFGGLEISADQATGLVDTWTFDGSTWTQQHPATSPSSRIGPSMAYDAAARELVLFGGASVDGATTTELADTWVYRPATAPAACPPVPFSDVLVDSPYCADIAWLKAQHITTGYPDGTFHPTADTTHQTTAALLYRTENPGRTPPDCTAPPYPDVPVDNPFCGAIAWLQQLGITEGNPGDDFYPTAPVSREVAARLLHGVSAAHVG